MLQSSERHSCPFDLCPSLMAYIYPPVFDLLNSHRHHSFIFLRCVGLSVVTLEKALEVNRISAKVGDNVEIRCDVSGNPPPPIVWKRYSADLTTLGDEDVRVFSDGSLYLTKIQLVHAGNYTCRALRNSEVTQTHVLTVHSKFWNYIIIIEPGFQQYILKKLVDIYMCSENHNKKCSIIIVKKGPLLLAVWKLIKFFL